MPDVTIASAAARTVFSSTLQANLFQLFQPMGGVCARPLGALLTTFWVVSPAKAFCAANRHAAAIKIAFPLTILSPPSKSSGLHGQPRGGRDGPQPKSSLL